jgi:hypothetical protein
MSRGIWIGSASIWLLASGGCANLFGMADDDPRAQMGGAEVCSQEKGALERTKKRMKSSRHPSVVQASLRVEAACQPAPNAGCAIARADLAELNARYGRRHRATLAARKAEDKACAGDDIAATADNSR